MNLDLFPVRVATPDTVHEKARLLIDDTRGLLFTEHLGVRFEGQVEIAEVERQPGHRYRIVLADGSEWQVSKASGCGCGSRLKRINQSELLTMAEVDA